MDAEVFVANLRSLLNSRGLSQRDFADRVGGDTEAERDAYYRWLRRAASQGVTRCEDRNRRQLQRICDFFGIHPVERLWSRSLSDTQNVADEYVEMLRYIIQTTTPLDGIGRMYWNLVDADRLLGEIRRGYELLLADRQLQSRLKISTRPKNGGTRPTVGEPSEQAEKTNTGVGLPADGPNDGESQEDYFLRRSLEKIRELAKQNPEAGSDRLIRQIGGNLIDIIRSRLPIDPDASMTFDDAWEHHVKPGLRAYLRRLESHGDDEEG